MSFDYNKWESELRSKVETHEFAFDDQAWADMGQLLDQPIGTIAPNDKSIPPSIGKFTPWLISGLAVMLIGFLSWWAFQTTQDHTIALSNFNITIAPEEEASKNQLAFRNASKVAEAGNTSNPKNQQVFPADATPQMRKSTFRLLETLMLPLTQVVSKTAQNPFTGELFIADRSAAYLTPTLWQNLAIPLLPTSLDEPALDLLPKKLERKRNRRTLYPDVIEQY